MPNFLGASPLPLTDGGRANGYRQALDANGREEALSAVNGSIQQADANIARHVFRVNDGPLRDAVFAAVRSGNNVRARRLVAKALDA